ncbi:succinylglutamate desuccinylase [Chitinilyticum piscinae]|uniref:Succinylglutamate desuccinylase n=1 Tax=Chitinilyticum piscinae TaxID=2866724 RepID=A0A8J7FGH7_9NEIS|nr:succinylglutamate desuccinylase [Chitinilyticum piscinae]MBE9608695.1 succinylglutamate desuccinylase [Chitinilyticum piscinae]
MTAQTARSFLAETLAGNTAISLPFPLPGGASGQVMDEGIIRFDPQDGAGRELDLVVSCGVHGNETAPVELVERLIARIFSGELKLRNRVMFVFGNVEALRRGTRFVEEDMNRLFCRAPENDDNTERRRATMLEMHLLRFFGRAVADQKPRYHYDLHTAIHGSLIEKFAIYPLPRQGRQFSVQEMARLHHAGVEAILLQSTTSTTFSFFSNRYCDATSFTVELGSARPFGQNDSVDLGKMEAYLTQLIGEGLPQHPLHGESYAAQVGCPVFRVSREIIKHSREFRLLIDGKTDNFTPLPQGMLLAEDGEHQTVVTEASARIIFPNPDVVPGQRAGLIIVPA